jgi:hypothetical protein
VLLVGTAAVSGWYSTQTFQALKQQQFTQAAVTARRAQWWLQPVNFLAGPFIPDVRLANTSLQLVCELSDLDIIVTNLKQLNAVELPQPQLTTPAIAAHLRTLQETVPHSWMLSATHKETALQALAASQDALKLYEYLKSRPQTFLVVFQNTDELRATGGFMGSFAKVEIKDGLVQSLTIEDIYQPDGQFTGYVAAPPGVAEYLSSGNGLRLPDANWYPDFPTSAQTILSYFALGTENSITGVLSLNSSLVTTLLQMTGPITLPNSDTTVTAENFTQVARSDRATFFPGSRQKSMFLKSFLTQFKLALADLPPHKLPQLIQLFTTAGTHKEVQVFALDENLQQLAAQHQLDGSIQVPDTADEYLFLVESNVGINKVNPLVSRSVKLDIADYQLTATITFTNQSSQDEYINYQRVIVPPTTALHAAAFGGQDIPLETIHDNSLTTYHKNQLRQYGILVAVPKNSQKTLQLTFTTPNYYQNTSPSVFIQKQAGLPATPYSLTFNGTTTELLLEHDSLVKMVQ